MRKSVISAPLFAEFHRNVNNDRGELILTTPFRPETIRLVVVTKGAFSERIAGGEPHYTEQKKKKSLFLR